MAFINQDRKTSIQSDRLNLKQTPADIWEYDDANKTSTPNLRLKEGWSLVDVIYPVGAFYTQYPDADSSTLATAFPDASRPADMFGGTWAVQWDDEGIDFHTERISDVGLQTRTNGLQADQMQGHWHETIAKSATTTGGAANAVVLGSGTNAEVKVDDPITDTVNGTPRTGTVTCDSNRLVRIWKRTA